MQDMRWFSVPRAMLGVLVVVLLSSCQLDRSGIVLRNNNARLVASPEIVCPRETVGIRWDLTTLPRSADNCRRCTTSASCGDGFMCLDGICCRGPELAGGSTCSEGGRCLPTTIDMTMTASDPEVPVPILPSPLPLRGAFSLPAPRPMDVSVSGSFALPIEGISDRVRVRVAVAPDNRLPLGFQFACRGSTFVWTNYDFAVVGPSTSDLIRIEGIRNTGRTAIALTGGTPRRDAVRILPGEVTTAFDGSPARGNWTAFIPADARPGPPPICSGTAIVNPLPDIAVEMTLACRRSP